MKSNKGFTLIDILISVAIVSFLSSVVLFNVSEGKVKAEDSSKKTEAAQVATAIELYKSDNNGKTPISVWSTNGTISPSIETGKFYEETSSEYQEVMNKLVETGYLSAIPETADDAYAYAESPDGDEAVFSVRIKSNSNISSNTKNSCSVSTELVSDEAPPKATPQMPQCTQTYVGYDQYQNDIYTDYCPPISGLEVMCTSSYVSIWGAALSGPGNPTYAEPDGVDVLVQSCQYVIPPPTKTEEPDKKPLCDGTQEDEYCSCI